MPESIKGASKIEGKVFQLAVEHLPITVYLDEAVFEKENVPMPSEDWTWEEMVELIETMTRPDLGIWSYNSYLGLMSLGPIALVDGGHRRIRLGRAKAITSTSGRIVSPRKLKTQRLGYRALQSSDEWAAVAGLHRRMARQTPALSRCSLTRGGPTTTSTPCPIPSSAASAWCPYPQPISEDIENGATMSFIDFAAIYKDTALSAGSL